MIIKLVLFPKVLIHEQNISIMSIKLNKWNTIKVHEMHKAGILVTRPLFFYQTQPFRWLILTGYWPSQCEVKMAGYWTSFFLCVFMDQEGVEVYKLVKRERGQYPAILTEQTWSINDLSYGFRGNFSCGTRRVVPSGQDSSIFPTRVLSQSQHRHWFILPAHGASHIIISQ